MTVIFIMDKTSTINLAPAEWAEAHLHDPVDIDCTTAVMLKILDGKCKMDPQEKDTIAMMYDVVKHRAGKLLDASHHRLIDAARHKLDDATIMQVYEQRLYAETMISRPVMKAYKAMLRGEGLIN